MKNLWSKLRPDSLWGQTVALTALIVAMAQILSIALFTLLVLRPELQRVAGVMAENVASMSNTLSEVPEADRQRLMTHMVKSSYIELWTGERPPDDTGPPPRLVERVFMRALVKAMGDKTDLSWRTDHSRKLWIHVWLGGSPYWISVKSPPLLGPTGLLLAGAASTFGLALLAAALLSNRLLRPLNALRDATEGYRLAAPVAPLREDGPLEIADLARSFNDMTARLSKAETDRNLILAGISHDVRTPLAKLKLAFEMMACDDETLTASAQRQIDRIDSILSQFLMYARGFEAEPIVKVSLPDLFASVLAEYGKAGVVMAAPVPDGTLHGRPEALRRALINLVENALHYGAVPVELTCQRTSSWQIRVRDHGHGVPDMQITALTQPFVRGDSARQPAPALAPSGTGLGLAMVDQIARLHGGAVTLRNLTDGFEVELAIQNVKDAVSMGRM
ncbi:ATP-binding protein [Asticcacaulis sp. 201]|uniref:ATP-binding protein n=1 Tax=Asticcacaulis sp. 201 TaxID=3028787 RepID=UPI002916682F|nr:ATP-binding protein [Asticcacaulis sp. 201]MDV6332896.1 ATP-binding protein [Asticcacaulis sp. 201]